ncbi:hypothetical protein BSL78_11538, partial [Apostichopus japonicus]
MDVSVTLFGTLLMLSITGGLVTEIHHVTRFLELGKNGIINCSFSDNFYGVYWYDSDDTVQAIPIISITEGVKTADNSGEYEIEVDGSLVVTNVSIDHEHHFTALRFHTQSAIPIRHVATAYVIVRPDKPFPVIDQCSERTRICFLPIENALTITCAVQKARPAVDIFWSRRIAEGEIDIVSQEKGVVNGNITFSSYAVMISQPLIPGQLLLLVCKGSTLPKLLKSEESVLLVQQYYRFRPEYSSSERRLVEKGSNTVIHCTQGELFYLVWTKFHENTVEQVAWAIFLKDNISNSMSETVEVGFNGSLKLIDINPNQDGLYSCNYNDGDSDMTNFYHVLVYVIPDPPYPIMSGCDENQYCIIEAEQEGTLTCSLHRVRPVVRLKLVTLSFDDSFMITVANEETVVTSNGDTYEVVLKTKYRLHTYKDRIRFECKTYGEYADLFEMSKKFELFFHEESNTEVNLQSPVISTDRKRKIFLAICVPLIGLLIIVFFVMYLILKLARNRKRQLTGQGVVDTLGRQNEQEEFAYDWCNKVSRSPMLNIELFISLRLRQLDGIQSFYEAVKLSVLPRDSLLTPEDIKAVMHYCKSVVVLLDGYDEYPDQDLSESNDITHIIRRNMFQQFVVIVTTRTQVVPKTIAPQSVVVRLTGFNERAQNAYIKKAIVPNDPEAAKTLMQQINQNPVLSEICEVPLFFVMFAHLIHHRKIDANFETVTSFFSCVVSCFHSHLRNKGNAEISKRYKSLEREHEKLDKLAFDGLMGNRRSIVWNKEAMLEKLGKEFYDHYIKVGILVEEEIPVTCIQFENCFSSAHRSTKCISLTSGLQVQNLSYVDELKITEMGREISRDELEGILEYSLTCDRLKNISFECCLLPPSLQNSHLLNEIQINNIKVLWIPIAKWFILDSAGQWNERYGKQAMTYEKEVQEFRVEW